MGLTTPSLARLKERVSEAADELVRLRTENSQLSDSLATLWAKTEDEQSGTSVSFDADREQLRERIERYIAIIDRHLEQ